MKKIRQEEIWIPKWADLFTILISVWVVDFITTILALNLKIFDGQFQELNPFSAWLFGFGFWGWVIAFAYSTITFFLLSFFSCKLLKRLKSEDYKRNLYYAILFFFIVVEGNAIFNNITLMFQAI